MQKMVLRIQKEDKLEWETTNHDLTTLQQNLDQVEGQNKELRVGKEARMAMDIKLEYWKQRAKANWDRQGDKPTTYFFKKVSKCVKTRMKSKQLRTTKDIGSVHKRILAKEFVDHFENLFKGLNE